MIALRYKVKSIECVKDFENEPTPEPEPEPTPDSDDDDTDNKTDDTGA